MKQLKFKKGDRVKCLVDRGVGRVGYTGTIKTVANYETNFPYIVKWDSMDLRSVRGTLDFKEEDLELLVQI